MVKRLIKSLCPFLLLTGCASGEWNLDSIATGNAAYDSCRLTYAEKRDEMHLELLQVAGGIEGFVAAKQFPFQSLPDQKGLASVSIQLGEEAIKTVLPLHEGHMRLHLPTEITQKLIETLAKGEKIDMVIGEMEQSIEPENFEKIYSRFIKRPLDLMNLVKNPLEE